MRIELAAFKSNSIMLACMGIILGGMVYLLARAQAGTAYPGFLIYAAAAYAFYRIGMSIFNLRKASKEKSPALSILRRIDWVSACVSILVLQTALFASFGSGNSFETALNIIVGSIIWLMTIAIGIRGATTDHVNV